MWNKALNLLNSYVKLLFQVLGSEKAQGNQSKESSPFLKN